MRTSEIPRQQYQAQHDQEIRRLFETENGDDAARDAFLKAGIEHAQAGHAWRKRVAKTKADEQRLRKR